MAEMGEGEVKLFRTWSSAYGLRITWALKLKGIQYENIDEDLSNKSPLLLMYNPIHKKIPVLLHNGKAIAESAVILEYIDETWKENPILPQDPHERAMARFIAKFGDEKVVASLKFSMVCVEIRNTGFNDSLILIGKEYGYNDSLLDVDYMDHLIWLQKILDGLSKSCSVGRDGIANGSLFSPLPEEPRPFRQLEMESTV